MSADNPNGSEGDDKPVPAAPVPANDSESVDPRAETRSRSELEDSAHSRSLPSWDDPHAAAASQDTGSQDTPANSGSANDGGGDSQQQQAGPGQDQGSGENSVSAESGSQNGDSPAPEAAGAQQDTGTTPGAVTVPADAQDGGLTPAPEAVDPGSQGENVPAVAGGANDPAAEPSRGELEDKVFSRPLPSWDDDAPAAAGVQDGASGPDAQGPVAGSDARQRTERDGQQQPAAPNREREQAEAQKSQSQQAENEKPDEASPPAPQQQQAYNEASHPEAAETGQTRPADVAAAPGTATPDGSQSAAVTGPAGERAGTSEADGQDPADAALAAAQSEEIPVTRPENSPSEASEEPNTTSAERPEDPAASTVTPETVAQEPGPAEDDPDAQPQGQLSAAAAESGTVGDDEPEESAAAPEIAAQASTTEHHPQTSDPEPEPDPELEATLIPGENDGQAPNSGAEGEHKSGNGGSPEASPAGGSGPPGPPGATDQPGRTKDQIWHITSEFHGQKLGMYTDGVVWKPEDVVQDALKKGAKEGQHKAPERHGITDFPQARDLGDSTVGKKPEQSPGDTSDLPPTGAELLEPPEDKQSIADRLRRKVEEQEFLGDLHDNAEDQFNNIQQALETWQPQGQPVQVHGPVYEQQVPAQDHVMLGDAVGASLMTGIFLFESGRRIHNMLTHRNEADQ